MNKRGQFFIVAAMIVVSVIAGLTSVVNYASIMESDEKINYVSKEIDSETKKVVDWGVFNSADIDSLTNDFLNKYSTYIGEDDVLFVFGDDEDLQALHYTFEGIGSVGLKTDEEETKKIEINRRTGKEADVVVKERESFNQREIYVTIDDIDYVFDLKEDQNFYLVIIKERDGEKFVVTR